MGIPIHVSEKILNHVSGSISGVAAAYNRHAYFEEMLTALLAWRERLKKFAQDQSAALIASAPPPGKASRQYPGPP